MTRFDAAEPGARRTLFAEAIAVHRERASPFLTIKVDAAATDGELEAGSADNTEETAEDALGSPWIQFADGVVNVDCTEDELEQLKDVLSEFPAFEIDELNRPEDAAGVNVRVRANADRDRVAQFLDAALKRTFELPTDYRAWVVEI